MSLTKDELSPKFMRSKEVSHATPARSDHTGVGPLCTSLFGAYLVACTGLTPGGHTHARGSHRDGCPASDGPGSGAPLYERPSRAQPGHVVGPSRGSDSARVASYAHCPPRGDSHLRGRRHCRAPAWPQDHGQGLLSGCRPFHEEECDALLWLEVSVDDAPRPGASEPAGLSIIISHPIVLAGGKVSATPTQNQC
jgi:hypothetical protein